MVLLKYFKFKATGKQPLPDPNGELSEKILSLGISYANMCVGKLLDLTSDDGNNCQAKLKGPIQNLTPAQIFMIATNHCLHTKHVLHAGLHDTLHVIQHVILRVTRECFVISTQFWAFTKILFANFCCELFHQKFLPPKFCIVQ